MSRFAARHALLLIGALVLFDFNTERSAQPGYVPVLQNWTPALAASFRRRIPARVGLGASRAAGPDAGP